MGVGRLLFPIFALALDLPEDFFDDKVEYGLTFHHPVPVDPFSRSWRHPVLTSRHISDEELGRDHESPPLPTSDWTGRRQGHWDRRSYRVELKFTQVERTDKPSDRHLTYYNLMVLLL